MFSFNMMYFFLYGLGIWPFNGLKVVDRRHPSVCYNTKLLVFSWLIIILQFLLSFQGGFSSSTATSHLQI